VRSVSDDSLDIRDGGVIAVDTGQLRAAASVLVGLSTRCDALRSTFETGTRELAAHDATAWPAAAVAVDLARVLHELAVEASALAGGLRDAADVYDIVELEVSRRAAADGDRRVTALLDHRIAEARERSPSAGGRADLLLMTWPLLRHGELQRQIGGATVPLGLLGGAAVAAGGLALTALGALGLGRTPPARGGPGSVGGAGPAPLVEVARSAAPPGSASPPLTLATLAERIPREGDQLRVERYTVAGGERRFAVYVAGTRSPLGFGGREPFDMSSNVQLYAGRTSASYESVVTALRAAGARSGDAVLAVGYSQGGAITSRLALDGPFRVVGNVTFGSPVQADPGDSTVQVTLRHTDDLVPALQAGGHLDRAGAPGSIVVERIADPPPGIADITLGAHSMDAYGDTASLADASGDPRVGDVHERLAQFVGDEPAEVTTYRVQRPE